jgi:4-diphosphocytidyl-2-C-methyl-D-erythritol kinase
MRTKIDVKAHAKINMSLSVGAADATHAMMHPIASMMTTVDFYDELCVTRLDEGDMSRYAILWHEEAPRKTHIDWPITSDLAVRAHRYLEAEVGISLPVQLKLEKRIPVGAGLGGGSSDAAAMLLATASLFDLDIDLYAIGAELGSDVPFLIDGGTQLVTGFGENLEPLQYTDEAMVLIMPPYGCATGEVYDAFDELSNPSLDLENVRAGHVFNDLTIAAKEVSQKLGEDLALVKLIAEQDVHLSGSGSSMFVICDNEMHAEALASVIEEKTGFVAVATHTIVPTNGLEKTE